MKKIVFTLVSCILLSFSLNANAKDAVSMVSYEQGWLDSKGTLSLKNNTDANVKNVSFVIRYLDMKGTPLDYKEYSYDIDIAPGMTKKLDIPAYEHERYYQYYKTKDSYGGHNPRFKIEYELKGYNLPDEEIQEDMSLDTCLPDRKLDKFGPLFVILLILFFIGLSAGLYVIVAVMAKNRNRSAILWLLLSFIASPLLVIIILLCIGNARSYEY